MWLRWYSGYYKETDEILGGYNPLVWDNTNNNTVFMQTRDSFIFSLKNDNIQNSILSRSYQSNFTIDNESLSFINNSEKLTRTTNTKFSIIDYEIFKVNRKTII
ncbi:hypothetical protein Glove_522g35 [Diversispora epigaea]|uniref:TLDc domain-containing protein n=1 Tax=Diversispora epigaea TaxID=1348612 RepID=A0A397GJZ4_9GLOM|nr:hypothetical protein Glove_522g35 [Diversispora epigaea]